MLLALLFSLPLCSGDGVSARYDPPRVSDSFVVDRKLTRERSGRILFGSSIDGQNSDNWIAVRNKSGWHFGNDALNVLSVDERDSPE